MKNIILGLFISILVLSACKDKVVTTPDENNGINPLDTITSFNGLVVPNEGTVEVNLSHVFDKQPITLNIVNYINAANDTFNIEDLRYYFTNLSFQKQNGDWVNLKSYHLVDFKTTSTQTFTISKLPAGHYKAVKYMLGVDSISNSSGLQEGALDPSWGMFWTWNTGYIFFRIMGRNPNSARAYSLDLGGNENLPTVVNDLNSFKLKNKNPKIYFEMDVNEMFQNPSNYKFDSDGWAIHTNTASGATKLALNMMDMVKVKKIE
jgi:hypothetical protein